MVSAVAAEDVHIVDAVHGVEGVRRHRNAVRLPFPPDGVRLQDGLRLGVLRGEHGGGEAVCKHFCLSARVVIVVDVAVDEFRGLLHAVEGHGKHGRKVEVHRLEIPRVEGDEGRLGRRKIVALVAGGVGVREPVLRVFGADDVDHARFHEGEVVAVALVGSDQVEHVLLGERGEHEAVFHFVVSVERAEEHFEFGVGKLREALPFADGFFCTLF